MFTKMTVLSLLLFPFTALASQPVLVANSQEMQSILLKNPAIMRDLTALQLIEGLPVKVTTIVYNQCSRNTPTKVTVAYLHHDEQGREVQNSLTGISIECPN